MTIINPNGMGKTGVWGGILNVLHDIVLNYYMKHFCSEIRLL